MESGIIPEKEMEYRGLQRIGIEFRCLAVHYLSVEHR
jgi:hypothetical protein